MNSQKIWLPAFLIVVLVQLYVPAKMIWDREAVLDQGTAFKFRTAPVDPYDPFRGKYISLRYEDNRVEIENEDSWIIGEYVYVALKTDTADFARIDFVSKDEPVDHQAFIKARVEYVSADSTPYITILYPFDRFYMEESKAQDAERMYQETQLDSTQTTYALVYVKNGDAVLKDVLIDGMSIGKVVKGERVGSRK